MKTVKIILASITVIIIPFVSLLIEGYITNQLTMQSSMIFNSLNMFVGRVLLDFGLGLSFAGLACFNKMNKYTAVVIAHFISFFITMFLLLTYILKLLGYVDLGIYYNYINPYMTALAVGFILVLAIRSLVIRLRNKRN